MRVGFVGWRGMVGSVLLSRMQEERDFEHVEPVFFSTSAAGGKGPSIGGDGTLLRDANDAKAFAGLDAIVTCQGSDWTNAMFPQIRASGFAGYWIDAASALRMNDDAVIILDPVNRDVIDAALARRREELHRRQLHGQPDDDGHGGAARTRSRRVDHLHDLPGRIGRRRAEHARAAAADGRGASRREGAARRSRVFDPRHRSRSRRHPARSALPDRAFRRPAGREPHSLDRQGPRQRHVEGRMEGRRRAQQDPRPRRPRRQARHPGRIDLRAHRRDALPFAGAHDQAARRPAARADRASDRRERTSGCGSFRTRATTACASSRPRR